jgi:predicted AAA+ superfamily ATPase
MELIDTLKALILDFQEQELEIGIVRRLQIEPVRGKATICIGVRRSGKSTFLFQTIQKLIDSGVSRQNILYINFFDDRLHSLQHDGLAQVLEAYYSIYPHKKNTEKIYCFFDEIQCVPNWESFVDRLLRTEKCEVYITGSSAQMLSKEIATQMRGRALSWEMFPFSFLEFLVYKNIVVGSNLSSKKKLLIQNAFAEYWQTGGFPEVLRLKKHLRIKTHQEYFNAVLFRDLIERHDVSHPKAITDLAYWLINNTAATYSINSLTGYLKSLGYKTPKSAVSQYLEWFEDAYFLFTVRIFDASIARTNTNPKRIYCIDHAMVTSLASGVLINSGHLLENLIFLALRRVTPNIYYYRSKSGKEVDFIIQTANKERMLVQVCESVLDSNTRKREVAALREAMEELKINSGTIVTRNQEEVLQVAGGNINIVPAWRFLLDKTISN